MGRPLVPNPPVSLRIFSDPPHSHAVSIRPFVTTRGRRYRLFVAAPVIRPPRSGFPSLYLLDGNAAFDALEADALARHPHLAVIGVGYETEVGFDFDARSRDYTPAARSGSGLPSGALRPHRPSGEAAPFLSALGGEIIPALEEAFCLDPARRTLWGHSYGGLLALHALVTTQIFSSFAIVSPSLWWDEGRILDDVADTAALPGRRVVLLRGAAERSRDASTNRAADRFLRLQALLERMPGLTLTARALREAEHRVMLARSLPDALAAAASPAK